MQTVLKLSLLPWLLCFALPVCAKQTESRAGAVSRAQSAMAYEERLWIAQKTLEAGNLEEAERLYRLILGEYQDDPRALLGLARVLHKVACRDGKYPPGFEELMNRLQDIVDEQGKSVAAMQSRLHCESESLEGNERLLAPLLFRRECPDPSLKNWFFLDPPC